MELINYLRQFKKSFSGYQPLIEVLIYKGNLLHNLKTFQKKYPDQKVAPMLKSNAYGHGLVPVAKILDKEGISFFVVDSIFEATILHKESIRSKILVIGYAKPQDINRNRYKNISFTLTNFAQLAEVSKTLKTKQSFHLKIDTGMHRQGILSSEIEKAIEKIEGNRKINLEGICSHFADADNSDKNFSRLQIRNWNTAVEKFKNNFPGLKYFHIAATAGSYYCDRKSINIAYSPATTRSGRIEERNIPTNTIRLGLGLYGIDSSPNRSLDLRPALELRTIISGVKIVQKGEYIGYGLTFKAPAKMRVAAIPAGYFEGVDRRLGNKGSYKIKNSFCPLVGRISMNISLADISRLGKIKPGDPVTLISPEPKDKNSAKNIAKICDTIPYEILVHIPQHLRRTIVVTVKN